MSRASTSKRQEEERRSEHRAMVTPPYFWRKVWRWPYTASIPKKREIFDIARICASTHTCIHTHICTRRNRKEKLMTQVEIKKSLVRFVESNYTDDQEEVAYLHHLIDEYIELMKIANKLRRDIKKRGVNVVFIDKNGNDITKKNESIAELNRTVQSMIRIQIQLGIRPQVAQNTRTEYETF